MIVSFPSDTERCLQLTREGVVIGGHVGLDYNCLSDGLLQIMFQNQMLKQPAWNTNMINCRREVCDAVRVHLVSHDDERLRPVQRDENHHVCDVSHEQHEHAYLEHMFHTETVIACSVLCIGRYDVNLVVAVVSLFIRVLILMICHLNIWTTLP